LTFNINFAKFSANYFYMNKRRDIYLILGAVLLVTSFGAYTSNSLYSVSKSIQDKVDPALIIVQEAIPETESNTSTEEKVEEIKDISNSIASTIGIPYHFTNESKEKDEEISDENTETEENSSENIDNNESESESEDVEDNENESNSSEAVEKVEEIEEVEKVEKPQEPIDPCANGSCFEANYASCTPDSYTVSSSAGVLRYDIIGKTYSGCRIKLTYLSHVNSEWENKDLLCVVPQNTPLVQAVDTSFANARAGSALCDGEMVAVLRQ